MQKINCAKCWKEIEKKWPRIYCIKCRCEVDKELAKRYREEHIDEIRKKEREYSRLKRESLKRDE